MECFGKGITSKTHTAPTTLPPPSSSTTSGLNASLAPITPRKQGAAQTPSSSNAAERNLSKTPINVDNDLPAITWQPCEIIFSPPMSASYSAHFELKLTNGKHSIDDLSTAIKSAWNDLAARHKNLLIFGKPINTQFVSNNKKSCLEIPAYAVYQQDSIQANLLLRIEGIMSANSLTNQSEITTIITKVPFSLHQAPPAPKHS
jgi:hypothetical protein